MKSREALLQSIASARTFTQSYVGSADPYLLHRIPMVIKMLDMMEERIRASTEVPGPDAFDDIRLGLYAVRELDEIDNHRLSNVLCSVDHLLKHR